MGPVIKRIAQTEWNSMGPGKIFFVRWSLSSAETLGNTVGTHSAPFVMIPFQPNFKQIAETAVRCNLSCWKMRVIIEDRFGSGIPMIESARRLRMQQKIIMDEFSHRKAPR